MLVSSQLPQEPSSEPSRKRMYGSAAYPSVDQIKDVDKFSSSYKMRKTHDGDDESRISTDLTSHLSLSIRKPVQKKPNPPKVSMKDLLKRLTGLKNEVKSVVLDNRINEDMEMATKNNVIHLRQLDSEKTDVYRAVSYIDDYNSRSFKIITNVLINTNKSLMVKRPMRIEPALYTDRIALKDPKDVSLSWVF